MADDLTQFKREELFSVLNAQWVRKTKNEDIVSGNVGQGALAYSASSAVIQLAAGTNSILYPFKYSVATGNTTTLFALVVDTTTMWYDYVGANAIVVRDGNMDSDMFARVAAGSTLSLVIVNPGSVTASCFASILCKREPTLSLLEPY